MKYLLTLTLFSLLFIACGDDEPTVLPTCIDEELELFRTEACPGGDLTIWRFQGRDVYCFRVGDCVAGSGAEIYDADCNLLCILGGPSLNDDCGGDSWSASATLLETVFVR